MTELTLTRKQIKELATIANQFKEVDLYVITSTSESGIGATVNVKFTVFSDKTESNTKIDITDVESW
ncbi:MAG: hypothetical protein EBY22_02355 [Gammaproteobacteria bacterium]|jgi:hypothetical protein|nr:hypothetical protein [Gammaproteobacteria bacterium]